jgi:hypothetical protein
MEKLIGISKTLKNNFKFRISTGNKPIASILHRTLKYFLKYHQKLSLWGQKLQSEKK